MSGLLSHAVMYLARSVLVTRRRRGNRLLQDLEPGGRGAFAGEKRVVAAGGALVEPLSDTIGAIDRARELLDFDVEWLVGRKVRLPHGVLAVGEARDVRDERFLLGRVLGSHDDDLGRHAHAAQVGVGILLLGEVDRGGGLSAIDDLQALEPSDAGGAIAWFAQAHLVGHDHDAVVVGHEALWCRAQRVLDASVDALAFHAQKGSDVGLQQAARRTSHRAAEGPRRE